MASPLTPDHLITERLRMRLLTEADYPHIQAFIADERATRHFPGVNDREAFARAWMDRLLQRYAQNLGGLLALIHTDSGDFIGHAGLLVQEVDEQPELEIGYHLMPAHWHQGYATEAATAFRNYAFAHLPNESIISIIAVANEPSKAVARRNGMTVEKRTRWRDMEVDIFRIRRS